MQQLLGHVGSLLLCATLCAATAMAHHGMLSLPPSLRFSGDSGSYADDEPAHPDVTDDHVAEDPEVQDQVEVARIAHDGMLALEYTPQVSNQWHVLM